MVGHGMGPDEPETGPGPTSIFCKMFTQVQNRRGAKFVIWHWMFRDVKPTPTNFNHVALSKQKRLEESN